MKRCVVLLLLIVTAMVAQATNRALLVGIGKYDVVTSGWPVIHGDNDVKLLRPWLAKRGFTDIVELTDARATKTAIVTALKTLANKCHPGDKVYFHFSGHGQPISDLNRDERKGKDFDESIIPYDACRDSRKLGGKYNGQNHLIDDELNPLLDAIKKKLGSRGQFFVVVDACFSRGIQKDEFTDLDPDLIRYMRGSDNAFYPKGRPLALVKLNKPSNFSVGATMFVATACAENERNFEYKAADGKMYGSLSFYISILLKSGADFDKWASHFKSGNYRARNIFQSSQHPLVEIFK